MAEDRYFYKTQMNGKRYLPDIRVSFHTEDNCYQMKGEVLGEGDTLDPTYQLISVTTNKSMDSPAGGFTIELVGTQWSTRLKSNDLVVIKMGYMGEAKSTVMVGLIDSVTRSRTIGGDGKPMVSTSVTGRDFGKLLIKSVLKFYPEIGGADGEEYDGDFFLTETGWITIFKFFDNNEVTRGTPGVMIDRIMRFIFPRLIDVKWTVYDESGSEPKPKQKSAMDIIRYQLEKLDFFLPFMLTSDQYEGSLWNLMERSAPKPFAELFIDTREGIEAWNNQGLPRVMNGTADETSNPSKAKLGEDEGFYPSPAQSFGDDGAKVVLTLRETPFDTKNWDKLMKHTIDPKDVTRDNFSVSDNEHYNLFWAGTSLNPLGIDMKREAPPLLNEKEAKRYGISPLEVQIEGLEILREKADDHQMKLVNVSKEYSARLKAWFQYNHEYWNGSITMRGNGRIKIGHVLEYPDPTVGKKFYVEGVSQSFSCFSDWSTTVTVTHGMDMDKKIDYKDEVPKPPKVEEEPPPAKEPDKQHTHHTVVSGDTLWAIAQAKYGDGTKWRKIWEANKDMLIARDGRNASDHGHWIYPGQKLNIPE